jgi:cytidylate kinase
VNKSTHHPSRTVTVITIDGPSASGKSTVSMRVAAALQGVAMLTGKHYRSVTHALMCAGCDMTSHPAIDHTLATLRMSINSAAALDINGRVFADADIENARVEAHVSTVANNPHVREALITLQRNYIAHHASPSHVVVIEGRDAGTVIAPEANLRYFLRASAEARAGRRQQQRGELPREATKAAIESRDARDQGLGRATEQSPGLRVIDTDVLSQEQVVDRILADLRAF